MNKRDLATELTWKLSAILEDCKRIEPALDAYLKDTDERPAISLELLRILSNALAAYELVHPGEEAGEFHGLPREVCTTEDDPDLTIRHAERPDDWDFRPWLLEKLNAMQKAARRLVQECLTELSTVKLHKDAPMTPRQYLRSGIRLQFGELKAKAKTVFQEVCLDKLQIEPTA
ncbi:MAG: hypothetical protein KGS61_07430 [Verrucomicrobia bacterium]|nr:hypothetical protein [Verrucomicrobiota bacterium]